MRDLEIKQRDSNIELLRILLILGVIVLHYNGWRGGFAAVAPRSINEAVLHLLENCSICAVNVFLIISGYYLCRKETVSYGKASSLIIQVIFWNEAITIINILLGAVRGSSPDPGAIMKSIMVSLIPANYYAILYVVVYLLAPYINSLIRSLDKPTLQRLIVTLLLIFSLWSVIADQITIVSSGGIQGFSPIGNSGGAEGYTIVNFMMMYFIGAYFRISEISPKRSQLLLLAVCTIAVLMVFDYIEILFNIRTAFLSRDYNSPFVIALACEVFLLFRELRIGYRKTINTLAKCCYTTFLIHTFFLGRVNIADQVAENCIIMILCIAATVVGIFTICFIAYSVYERTIGTILRKVLRF